jgi:hypothetical protein
MSPLPFLLARLPARLCLDGCFRADHSKANARIRRHFLTDKSCFTQATQHSWLSDLQHWIKLGTLESLNVSNRSQADDLFLLGKLSLLQRTGYLPLLKNQRPSPLATLNSLQSLYLDRCAGIRLAAAVACASEGRPHILI